jgi:hypothetical protein
MSYQYDLADFKRYLYVKNPKYRVDGLVFWQNRIPLPIDLFNQIFDESEAIMVEYVRQVTVSALVFCCADEWMDFFGTSVNDLPGDRVSKREVAVTEWINDRLEENPEIGNLSFDVAELLSLDGFDLVGDELTASLSHQGKKYARLFMPSAIRDIYDKRVGNVEVGKDNTDMFGNIIADRYSIYRSGFSDALAIIFNALLDFRILCAGRGSYMKRLNLFVEKTEGMDIRFDKTSDGSLWEPRVDDDLYVSLNPEHPFLRNMPKAEAQVLAELLYYLAEFENSQFSDTQRKLLENMRQEVSRSLWIRHD